MATESALQQLLEERLAKRFEQILGHKNGSLELHYAGLNRKTRKFRWFCVDVDRQKMFMRNLRATLGSEYGEQHEIPSTPQNGQGLAALCFTNNNCVYSPHTQRDYRTIGGKTLDKRLELHSALFIPVISEGQNQPTGVLVVNCLCKDEHALINNSTRLIAQRGLVKEYIQTEEKVKLERIASSLDELLAEYQAELATSYFLLNHLFEEYLGHYYAYAGSFDAYIIQQHLNIKAEDNYCEYYKGMNKFLEKIEISREDPHKVVSTLLENTPAGIKLKQLADIEESITEIGYRKHFEHMFHVLTLGNVLLGKGGDVRKYFAEALERDLDNFCNCINMNEDKSMKTAHKELKRKINEPNNNNLIEHVWQQIATSHDIGIPLEQTDTWLKQIFESYFKDYDVSIYISPQAYFAYGNFPKYRRLIVNYLSAKLKPQGTVIPESNMETLLDNMVALGLTKRIGKQFKPVPGVDHAMISAFLAMDSLERLQGTQLYEKKWRTILSHPFILTVVGTSVFLHNFHKWKKALTLEFLERSLPRRVEAKAIREDLGQCVIDFTQLPFAFLLIFCDALQEVGREGSEMEERQIRIKELTVQDEEVQVSLVAPRAGEVKIDPREHQKQEDQIAMRIASKYEEFFSLRDAITSNGKFVVNFENIQDSRTKPAKLDF